MTAETRNVQFRRAAGRFPTGVAVVGTLADAEPHAMTVNSFVTVSLDPLLVLVSVELTCRTYQRIRSGSGFAVTVLSAAQQDIAGWFASRRRGVGAAAFAGIDWHPAPCSAAPVLKGGISYFDCTVAEIRIAGDHALVIGAVEAFDILSDEPPLMFLDSSYITVGAR
ncbi:flavin reductase family protein [Micromonosporaceae bacterium Da 78-11]